jgi:N-acetyl-alpha-D-muramate 1-phosphate uridylyltransferase
MPLTKDIPKAMVELNGKPLIWHAINTLKNAGITEITVNVHHHAEIFCNYLRETNWEVPINISDESNSLLDTGGGLLNAREYLEGEDPFLVANVDVISAVDFNELFQYHRKHSPLATLVVRKRETNRLFLFDEKMVLNGWTNTATGEKIIANETFQSLHSWAFSGIQVVSPEIFKCINETGKFAITPLYLRLAKGNRIIGYPDYSDFWIDLGKPGQLEIAEKYLAKKEQQ